MTLKANSCRMMSSIPSNIAQIRNAPIAIRFSIAKAMTLTLKRWSEGPLIQNNATPARWAANIATSIQIEPGRAFLLKVLQ